MGSLWLLVVLVVGSAGGVGEGEGGQNRGVVIGGIECTDVIEGSG